jgi:hypothetical protein
MVALPRDEEEVVAFKIFLTDFHCMNFMKNMWVFFVIVVGFLFVCFLLFGSTGV